MTAVILGVVILTAGALLTLAMLKGGQVWNARDRVMERRAHLMQDQPVP